MCSAKVIPFSERLLLEARITMYQNQSESNYISSMYHTSFKGSQSPLAKMPTRQAALGSPAEMFAHASRPAIHSHISD